MMYSGKKGIEHATTAGGAKSGGKSTKFGKGPNTPHKNPRVTGGKKMSYGKKGGMKY